MNTEKKNFTEIEYPLFVLKHGSLSHGEEWTMQYPESESKEQSYKDNTAY